MRNSCDDKHYLYQLMVFRQKSRFPGEDRILPQDCNIKIQPEFLTSWPILQISDLRHQFLWEHPD